MFSAPCAQTSARISIVLEKLTAGFSAPPGTIFVVGRRTVGRLLRNQPRSRHSTEPTPFQHPRTAGQQFIPNAFHCSGLEGCRCRCLVSWQDYPGSVLARAPRARWAAARLKHQRPRVPSAGWVHSLISVGARPGGYSQALLNLAQFHPWAAVPQRGSIYGPGPSRQNGKDVVGPACQFLVRPEQCGTALAGRCYFPSNVLIRHSYWLRWRPDTAKGCSFLMGMW